jgi:polysaccharide biosynthesis protein PslL
LRREWGRATLAHLPKYALRRTELASSRTTIPFIDVARGIGISLVIFGHLNDGTFLRNWIYLFHMPFFFFLSGYLHKVTTDYFGFVDKKFKHLMVPYFSYLVLLSPIEYQYHHAETHGLIRTLGALLWGGDALRGPLAVFWFVSSLFLTQQAMNWILSRFSLGTVTAITAGAYVLSYVNSIYAPWFKLPFDAQIVLGAMPFFLLGHVARKVDLTAWWIRGLAVVGAIDGGLLVYRMPSFDYEMRGGDYGWPVASFLFAACCILSVLFVSELITRFEKPTAAIGAVGALSMGIMYTHLAIRTALGVTRLQRMNPVLALAAVLAVSYLVSLLFSKGSLTRRILLGSSEDEKRLFTVREGVPNS